MTLQQERIHALCEQLRLPGIASGWSAHAQAAAAQDGGYADFLEAVLRTEVAARQERTRQTLLKLATLPTVKMSSDTQFHALRRHPDSRTPGRFEVQFRVLPSVASRSLSR